MITYDTSSLLDGIASEGQENRARNGQRPTVIPKLKRPQSSSQYGTSPMMAATRQSVNELFNRKLIEHGTDKGVPKTELPEPHTLNNSLNTSKSGAMRLKKTTGIDIPNYASSY